MKQTLPSISSRSPTLVKNMISGLSYGALNASYQVVDWSPPSALPPPHFPSSTLVCRRDIPPPSLAETGHRAGRLA